MPRAEGVTAVRQRIIDRYSSREDIESKGDLVAGVVVGRPDASDYPESLERYQEWYAQGPYSEAPDAMCRFGSC
jgi:hypothetical protein